MNIITTPTDMHGLCFCDGAHHVVRDTIIDLSAVPMEELDEAVSVTWGSSASFKRCLFRGAGKLVLIGSGDKDKREIENKKCVTFTGCIFENFGRRGIEVQSGMIAVLDGCVVRNWGDPSRFDTRNFATWRHDTPTPILASNTIYYQDTYHRPMRQWVTDHLNHIGQAWNDDGIRGLFSKDTYTSGVRRAIQENGRIHRFAKLHSELTPQELEQIAKIEAPFMDYYRSIGQYRLA